MEANNNNDNNTNISSSSPSPSLKELLLGDGGDGGDGEQGDVMVLTGHHHHHHHHHHHQNHHLHPNQHLSHHLSHHPHDNHEEDGVPDSKRKKEGEWSAEAVRYLLDAYERLWADVNHGFMKKKHWEEVAREVTVRCGGVGKPKTGPQCKSKVEKLKHRFRHEKTVEHQTGGLNASKWQWLGRMESMMGNAPHLASAVEGVERILERGGCNNSGGGSWYHVPELSLRNHHFNVPLDYNLQSSPLISLFAREIVSAGKEDKRLPYLLFLQGGPGFECHRPLESNGWLKRACEDYRVILMDQRGTGLSTSLTAQSLGQLETGKEQASYLQHFRADNIVRDAELIRSFLVPNGEPWALLGQSYGGFCAVTYLSMAPTGLRHVILTGGLPPLDGGCSADAVYRACFKRVLIQNFKYYERFPQDEEVVREVVLYLAEHEGGVPLPSGGRLTPKGLQLLGLSGLGSSGGFERLHYIFERAWDPILVSGAKKQLSFTFLRMYENWLDFDTNPLYAVMHESIYCQAAASKWAAQRVREEMGPQFDAILSARKSARILFTGEMVFPWMFDEIAALRPLKEAAHILADKVDWPYLYNKEVLRVNKVPIVAAIYYEDMYVNFNISEATASRIAGIRVWITNEYMHSGLREDGVHVLSQLLGMLKGKHLQR